MRWHSLPAVGLMPYGKVESEYILLAPDGMHILCLGFNLKLIYEHSKPMYVIIVYE